jgi:transcription factor SFP1
MSFQPQSLGTSYSRRQVHSLMLRSDNEIAKDYQCCGIDLPGIHALMEHVEDMHPDGSDPVANYAAQYGSSTVDNAIAMDMELEDIPEASGSDTRSSQSPKPTGPTYAIPPSTSKPSTPDVEKGAPFSPTSAWLKSEVLVSPAAEPSATKSNQSSSSSTPPDGTLATPLASRQHSPVFTPKIGTTRGFMGTGVGVQSSSAGLRQQRFDRAFNDVVTGKKDNKIPDSVAPGMLFATGPVQAGIPTVPAVGRNGQPAPTKENEAPLPAPSLFSPHKPWRCPTPGCNKAYKQSNGLKYHQQKG